MTTTFDTDANLGAIASYDPTSKTLNAKLKLATAGVTDDDLIDLLIEVIDSKSGKTIKNQPFTKSMVDNKLTEKPGVTPAFFNFSIALEGQVPEAVLLYITENVSGATDRIITSSVSLAGAGPAPSCSVQNPVFTVNATGVVSMAGSVRVSASNVAGLTGVVVYANYTKSSDGSFARDKLTTDAGTLSSPSAPNKIFTVASIGLTDIKSDTAITFSARAIANDRYSDNSNVVSLIASVRLAAPVLTTVRSFKDRMIDVSGTVAPAKDNTEKFSILAQVLTDVEDELDPKAWIQTNQRNKTIGSTSFMLSVTKMGNGTDATQLAIPLDKVIAFIAVKHKGDFNSGTDTAPKSVDILETVTANKPPGDQSPASNVRKGVAIARANKETTLNLGSQTFDKTLNTLRFTPSATPALLSSENVQHSFTLTSSKKGVIVDDVRSASSTSAFLDIFLVKNVILDDEYTLSVKSLYFVSQFIVDAINAEKSLSGVLPVDLPFKSDPKTDQTVLELLSLSTSVMKSGDADTAPVPQNVRLETTRVNGSDKLLASFTNSYDKKLWKLKTAKVQVAQGRASSDPASFVPLYRERFQADNSPFVPAEYSDFVPVTSYGNDSSEAVMMPALYSKAGATYTLVSIDAGDVFSCRAAGIYEELKFPNSNISGNYSASVTAVVPPSVMDAPEVALATEPQLSGSGKSVRATVKLISPADVKANAPANWGGDDVTASAVIVRIIDSDGKTLASKSLDLNSSDAPSGALDAYNATATSAKYTLLGDYFVFRELPIAPSEVIRAQAQVLYKRVRDDTNQTALSGNSNPADAQYQVPDAVKVGTITLSQAPISSTNTTGRKQVDPRDDANSPVSSLTITAVVELGQLETSKATVKAIMAAGNSDDAATAHSNAIHDLVYDATTKVWSKSGIVRDTTLDYYTQVNVMVYAIHPLSSNGGDANFI